MRRLIAVALLLGLPGFARGQDEPLFHLIVRDPLPLLERAARSPAVQEVFSSRALGDLLPLPKSLTARGLPGLVHFAAGMMPTRVEIRIPGTAAKPVVAFLHLGLLCVALVELQDEAEDRAPELRTRLVASLARSLVDLRDLRATATLELRTEAIARQVIDGITEGRSCCVVLDQEKPALQILPAGSFTGDDFMPMCTLHQHRAFACELRGGLRTWCLVVPVEGDQAFVQAIDYDRFAAASRSGAGPLEDGALAWIDIANQG